LNRVAIFGPIYAFTSLFVYCLDWENSQSDLATLDIGTGYFAKLCLTTDAPKFIPFARAITSLAYNFEKPFVDDDVPHNTEIAGAGAEIPEYSEDFWESGILDGSGMLHLEEWSEFLCASEHSGDASRNPF
jgi:hypothetical protein